MLNHTRSKKGVLSIHSRPWVRIVIVAYNSRDHLQKCLNALAIQTCKNFEVVIVNNNTPDNCIELLHLPDARFVIIKSEKNLGFAGGSNLGLCGSHTPWLMTINPDVQATPTFLEHLFIASKKYSGAAMFAPLMLRTNHPDRLDGMGDVLSIYGIPWRGGYNKRRVTINVTGAQTIFAPCGASALYRSDIFKSQNGFDELFFCYLEDVDLALRINANGGTCLLIPEAIVFHVGGSSTEGINGFQDYHTSKNNLRMIIKSAPIGLLPIMLFGYFSSQIWITLRNFTDPRTKHKLRGYRQALTGIPSACTARIKRPHYPFGASLSLARKLVWKKKYLRERSPHYWPIAADLTTPMPKP